MQTVLVHTRRPWTLLRELGPKATAALPAHDRRRRSSPPCSPRSSGCCWSSGSSSSRTGSRRCSPGRSTTPPRSASWPGNFLLVFLSLGAAVSRGHDDLAPHALLIPCYWAADERRDLHGARRAVLPPAPLAQDRARPAPGGGADMSVSRATRRRPRPRTAAAPSRAHRRRRRHLRARLRRRSSRSACGWPRGASAGATRCLPLGERAVRPAQRRSEARGHRLRLDAAARAAQRASGRRSIRSGRTSSRAASRPRSPRAACGGATAAMLLHHGAAAGAAEPDRLGLRAARVGQPDAVPVRGQRDGGGRRRAVPDRRRVLPHAVLALRRALWVAAAGVALALGVASEYQAVPYGAAAVRRARGRDPVELGGAPVGAAGARRARSRGSGCCCSCPPIFVGLLWIGANAVIMGDPLVFMYGAYGYASYQGDAFTADSPSVATGDLAGGARRWSASASGRS